MFVTEDKIVDKETLSAIYHRLDDSFNKYLLIGRTPFLFQEIMNISDCLQSLNLFPDGVSFYDIWDCLYSI